jgi:hypothetical protein
MVKSMVSNGGLEDRVWSNLTGLRNPSKRTHVASQLLGSGDLGWIACLAAAGPFESQRVSWAQKLVKVVQP